MDDPLADPTLRRTLEDLTRDADNELFQKTLALLTAASGRNFVASTTPIAVKREPSPSHSGVASDSEIGLILVGLKLDESKHQMSPWLSDLLRLAGDKSPRFQAIVDRWNPSNTFVTCSREALPIENDAHRNFGTGCQGVGYFSDILFPGGQGGVRDIFPSPCLESAQLTEVRGLYEMGQGTTVYALYLYYHDPETRAAYDAAADFSPARASKINVQLKSEPGPAAALHRGQDTVPIPQGPRPSATMQSAGTTSSGVLSNAHTYILHYADELMAEYRLFNSSTALSSAYKTMAGVRMVQAITLQLKFPWPARGIPTEMQVEYKNEFFEISLTDILEIANGPAAGTFRNHYNNLTRAKRCMTFIKQQAATNPASVTAPDRATANAIHAIVNLPLINPTLPIPSEYSAAVALGYEDFKKFCKEVANRPGYELTK
ncbi:hypothetical protein B0H16DRAFT_1768327 [Mycena metata]|uniref:Uncharacterized protein n=1 Tax=Mycena metata TaxID=1033252 RepID=A0AAD7I2L3_9AGAR|nr:hypothetical protein B0H16DRAFT_1768327 [Mycena metata]